MRCGLCNEKAITTLPISPTQNKNLCDYHANHYLTQINVKHDVLFKKASDL
jgi:hypothetical protein